VLPIKNMGVPCLDKSVRGLHRIFLHSRLLFLLLLPSGSLLLLEAEAEEKIGGDAGGSPGAVARSVGFQRDGIRR